MHEITLNNIQLQDLEIFLAVAKYGNFTKAGEKTYVTQSWVSKRMNALENELGLQLFVRASRRMTLTPAGRYLQERLEHVHTYLLESLQEANRIQTGISGSIRIGILEWATNAVLEPLRSFIDNHPQISVDVLCQQFREFRGSLENDRIDLIFTMEYDNISFLETSISCTRLHQVQIMAYMSKDNPLSQKKVLEIEDLRSQEMLMLNEDSSSGYNEFVNGIFRQKKIRPLISQYASNGREHLVNILFNRGILIASSMFLGKEYSDQICAVPIKNVHTYVTAVWKKENPNPVIPMMLQEIHIL